MRSRFIVILFLLLSTLALIGAGGYINVVTVKDYALDTEVRQAIEDSLDVYMSVDRDTSYVNIIYQDLEVVRNLTVNGVALLIPDFAGIYHDGDGLITVGFANAFEQVTTFNADLPEVVSNGTHGTDDITIGATSVYEVIFTAGALSAAPNKVFEFFAFEKESSSAGTITGITNASPGVVTTSSAHGLSNDDRIIIEGVSGMTEVNGNMYTVAGTNTTTFQLNDDAGAVVNTGGYGSWTSSSGTVTKATKLSQIHAHRKFGSNSDEGAFSGAGIVSLTSGKTLELWFKGTTDATNLTIQECSFYMKRLQ